MNTMPQSPSNTGEIKEQLKDILEVINFFKEEQDIRDEQMRSRIENMNDMTLRSLELGKRETAMQLEPMQHDV